MKRFLTPRWLVGHLVVGIVGVTCLLLGFWQLDRLEERRVANVVHATRFAEEPRPISQLLDMAGADIDSLAFRRATATGEYVPAEEVLIRSKVRQGIAGFHVVTPLVDLNGRAVAVDRGWVPLEFDTVPVTSAPPPSGMVTVTGLVRLSEERGTLGREDTSGNLTSLSRIDITFLDSVVSADLLPVYLQILGDGSPIELPAGSPPPDFADEGPHFSYAIQWFSFAAVIALGYGFLLRRASRNRSRRGNGEILHHFDSRESGEVGT